MIKRRNVFISGGSGKGIGRVISQHFASKGDTVIINGRKTEELDIICSDIKQNGGVCIPALFDITDSKASAEFFEKFQNQYGAVNVFIHNAAASNGDYYAHNLMEDIWELELSTILTGAYNCLKSIVPSMINEKYGKIVLISSNAGTTGSWGRNIGYASAKAGLLGMSRRLAIELAVHQINVNCIIPCQIETPRTKNNGRRSEAYFKEYVLNYAPFKRMGQPIDIANLVWFLSSNESNYITGQKIVIDGGASFPSNFTKPEKII